jgi:hypothetical protein
MQLPSMLIPLSFFFMIFAQDPVQYIIMATTIISDKVQVLNVAIGDLSATSTTTDFYRLTNLGDAIVEIINDKAKGIMTNHALGLMDGIRIQSSLVNYTAITNNTVDALIEKKDLVLRANQKDLVLKLCKALESATITLHHAVTSILPIQLFPIIAPKGSSYPLTDSFERGIKTFS